MLHLIRRWAVQAGTAQGVLTLIALCLLILTARALLPGPAIAGIGDDFTAGPSAPAQPNKVEVPRAWGRRVAVAPGQAAVAGQFTYFESPDGTVRGMRLVSGLLTIERRESTTGGPGVPASPPSRPAQRPARRRRP